MKVALWAEIHRLHEIEKLSERAIARRVHCGRDTVKRALELKAPPNELPRPSSSIIDPYKPDIDRLIDTYPDLSAVRVLEEISKKGYPGKISLVQNYLREVRPARGRVYQEVEYPPGDAMQVDWGHCGTVRVGETVRKIYVFVAVLCFSRLLYIEFSLSMAKAMFYRAIVNALLFFGGIPARLIVDNLKAAVLEGSGRTARFHPEFEALCAHHRRMKPVACERYDPESKGVAEGSVRYVKHNALKGRKNELVTVEDYQRLAVYWRDKIANVRDHKTTRERPVDRFEKERGLLRPLPEIPYDTDEIVPAVVTPHARINFDTNRYSVPPDFLRKKVIVRADDDQIRVFYRGEMIARHRRSWKRRQLIVDPEHQKAALARRKRLRAREIERHFDSLGPEAKSFRLGLLREPVKPTIHLRRILELVRLYGRAEVMGALGRAVEYETFDAAYVKNLIDQERRRRQLPSPIPLTPKRRDLLEDEIDLDEPDPGEYDDLLQEL
jgi:transposase